MKNYKPSNNKNSNKWREEDYFHGYFIKRCDLKCYKCRYQGICVVPRRIIEARKRFIITGILSDLFNNKYRRINDLFPLSLYNKLLLRYLVNNKKKKVYKNSD